MDEDFVILLAEDDENDAWLVQRALFRAGILNPIMVARDGQEAIDYLEGMGPFADRENFPVPSLALLDIKMPKKNGLEVLEWVRHNGGGGLKLLPVIIMSSSNIQEDIDRAYELGVNAYLVKPTAFAELVKTLKATTEFWKDFVAHPSKEG
jgi:CheY-like chemotaxis protein